MNRYRTTMLLPRPWDGTHFVADGFGVWLGAVEGASPERAVTETATTPEAKRAATPRAGDLLSRDVVARSLWIAGDTPPRSRLVSAQDLARQSVFHPTVWAVSQSLQGLCQRGARHNRNSVIIMEQRHQLETDIFGRIGDNADHFRHTFPPAYFHRRGNLTSARHVHRLQPSQVRQQPEFRLEQAKRRLDIVAALHRLGLINGLAKCDMQTFRAGSARTRIISEILSTASKVRPYYLPIQKPR